MSPNVSDIFQIVWRISAAMATAAVVTTSYSVYLRMRDLTLELSRLKDVVTESDLRGDLTLAREKQFIPSLAESLREDLHSEFDFKLAALEDLYKKNSIALSEHDPSSVATQGAKELIGRIRHNVNTPLSQIEAITFAVEETKDFRQLSSIHTALDLIKATLTSFSENVASIKSSTAWQPKHLSASVEDAIKMFANAQKKTVEGSVTLPSQVPGYSNSFLLSILGLLIENAVEASRPGEAITVRLVNLREQQHIIIRSLPISLPPEGEAIYALGYSTKSGHEGVGLGIIRELLRKYPGTSLTHSVSLDIVTFYLGLPKYEKN